MKFEDEYTFPFKLHDYQMDAIKFSSDLDCVLYKHVVGQGKSAIAIAAALEHAFTRGVERILILCPPILMDQWKAFIDSIQGIGSCMVYRGSPGERKRMYLTEAEVVICSYHIFRGKADHQRFIDLAARFKLAIIADELSLKSLKSQTFRKLKKIVYRKMRLDIDSEAYHSLLALNATPLSDPSHVYNWCAIFVPGVYMSKKLFDVCHVTKEDHWGNVIEWRKTDLLQENMEIFSIEASPDIISLPEINYNVVDYKLAPKHLKTYKEIEDAQFAALPKEKIELAINSMFSTLQRVALVPEEFDLDIRPAILDFLDSYLSQLREDDQVIVFTRHVKVSKMLHDYIPGSVAIYGGVSQGKREEAFKRLRSGEAQVLVANTDSVGHGLNLHFMNRIVFAELPFREDRFTQAVGRIHRQGQQRPCYITVPLAIDTIQSSIYWRLIQNGEDISAIMKSKQSLKEFLT